MLVFSFMYNTKKVIREFYYLNDIKLKLQIFNIEKNAVC